MRIVEFASKQLLEIANCIFQICHLLLFGWEAENALLASERNARSESERKEKCFVFRNLLYQLSLSLGMSLVSLFAFEGSICEYRFWELQVATEDICESLNLSIAPKTRIGSAIR